MDEYTEACWRASTEIFSNEISEKSAESLKSVRGSLSILIGRETRVDSS